MSDTGACYACNTLVFVACECDCKNCKKANEFESRPDTNGYGITIGQNIAEMLSEMHKTEYGIGLSIFWMLTI